MQNIVALEGNLTKDGELRFTQSGLAVFSFTLAQTMNGEGQFFDCVVFGKHAEYLGETNFQKGQRLLVMGYLRQEMWVDKDGKKRSKIKVVAKSVQPITVNRDS